MSIQKHGTNVPREKSSMSVMAARDPAIDFAQSLERRERDRGASVTEARFNIAARARIGVGTFENIVRERVKRIDGRIRSVLQALLVRELEAEIERLTHELDATRRSGTDLDAQHVREIEAHLGAARAIIRGTPPANETT